MQLAWIAASKAMTLHTAVGLQDGAMKTGDLMLL